MFNDLIWIQTFWHSDVVIDKEFFQRDDFGGGGESADNKTPNNITLHAKSVYLEYYIKPGEKLL